VCANSLVVSDKALSAKRGYNLRVVETLVAARILGNSLGLDIGLKDKTTLREVVGKLAGKKYGEDMGPDVLEKVLAILEQQLHVLKPDNTPKDADQLGVTMDEMVGMSGLSQNIFHEVYLSWVDSESIDTLSDMNLFIPHLTKNSHSQSKRPIFNCTNAHAMYSPKLGEFSSSGAPVWILTEAGLLTEMLIPTFFSKISASS